MKRNAPMIAALILIVVTNVLGIILAVFRFFTIIYIDNIYIDIWKRVLVMAQLNIDR